MPTNNFFLDFSYFWPSYFTSLYVLKVIPAILSNSLFLYTSVAFSLCTSSYSHTYSPNQKSSPILTIQLIQTTSRT